MRNWQRRIRGAVGMGLTWAAGWALVGVLIGVTSRLLPGLPWDALFEVFDAPLPALAIPGFIGGALGFGVGCRSIGVPALRLADVAVVPFVVGHALGPVRETQPALNRQHVHFDQIDAAVDRSEERGDRVFGRERGRSVPRVTSARRSRHTSRQRRPSGMPMAHTRRSRNGSH